MKINVVTAFYNSEDIAPLFFNHYKYANKIIIIFDSTTTDRTLNIIDEWKQKLNIEVIAVEYPEKKFNDRLKVEWMMEQYYRSTDVDWVFFVDDDEFIYPTSLNSTIQEYLEKNSEYDIILTYFTDMVQYNNERELNYNESLMEQRKWGAININPTKPAILKSNLKFEMGLGQHNFVANDNIKIKRTRIPYLAHFAFADFNLAVNRRLKNRQNRLDTENIKFQRSVHWEWLKDEEAIKKQIEIFKQNAKEIIK